MARNGENIYLRKDGRWEGRYIRGRKPDGKAVYGYVYGKRRGEVRNKLIPLKAAYMETMLLAAEFDGTMEQWAQNWLEHVVKPSVKPSTYASYHHKLQTYIFPHLGKKKLKRITPADIQGMADRLEQGGMGSGSVRSIMQVLKCLFQRAKEEGCIYENPASAIKISGGGREISALRYRDQKALERQAFFMENTSAEILSLYTGMRIGEISGLRWSDIDFDSRLIHIQRTLQRVKAYEGGREYTRIVIGEPKSRHSKRVIPIPDQLALYLERCQKNADSPYVVSCRGSFAEPRVISYRFAAVLKQTNLQPVRFHCLRHTFATRCLEKGVDIATLSRLLGHASIKMTLDTYADSMMEQRRKAMAALDAQLLNNCF